MIDVTLMPELVLNVETPEFAETWRIPKSSLLALPVKVCVPPPPLAKMILLLADLVTVVLAPIERLPRRVISAAGKVYVALLAGVKERLLYVVAVMLVAEAEV